MPQMSTILQTFAGQTGFHGVSKVILAQSPVRRCIWATICFVVGIVAVCQIAEVVNRYTDYQKHVSVELVADEAFPFPSVSVCHMRNLDFHVLNTINRMFNENEPSHYVNSNESQFVREYMRMVARFQELSVKYRERHDLRDVFDELYSRTSLSANIPAHVISPAGIQLNEFMVTCFFGGEQCNLTADITSFFDSYFYNCFTYTAPSSGEMPAEGLLF
jgi:Amiloride-sensitive sodium channel